MTRSAIAPGASPASALDAAPLTANNEGRAMSERTAEKAVDDVMAAGPSEGSRNAHA
jgi:hypothetical protein